METSIRSVDGAVLAAVAASVNPSDWFALLDQQQQCLHLQRGALGDIPERLIGMLRGDSNELVSDVLRRGAQQDTVRVFDDPQLGPRIFEYQFRPLNDSAGVAAVVISCNEATAQRAARRAGRLQSEVLEALNDGVLLVGADDVVKLFNPAAQQLLGWRGRVLAGESIADVNAALASLLHRGGDMPAGIEVARSSENPVFLECRLRSLRIEGLAHQVIVLRDVTAQRRLEREVIDTEQRERDRIARELHDGLGQELTGVALLLRSVLKRVQSVDTTAAERLQEAVAIVNTVIAGTRQIASGIFAVSIPDRDLAGALRALAERAAARSGVAIRFEARGDATPQLTDSAASSLFRIAQEATTNALRHSGATSVSILLGSDAGGVVLSIADNGCGCPTDAEQNGGAGLRIMRFRAHALGGQFKMTSAPERGTKIECTLPAVLA